MSTSHYLFFYLIWQIGTIVRRAGLSRKLFPSVVSKKSPDQNSALLSTLSTWKPTLEHTLVTKKWHHQRTDQKNLGNHWFLVNKNTYKRLVYMLKPGLVGIKKTHNRLVPRRQIHGLRLMYMLSSLASLSKRLCRGQSVQWVNEWVTLSFYNFADSRG